MNKDVTDGKIPEGILKNDSFFTIDYYKKRHDGFIGKSKVGGKSIDDSFKTLEEASFLSEKDKEIEQNAMYALMGGCAIQATPGLGTIVGAAIDLEDVLSNKDATIQWFKRIGVIDEKYEFDKTTFDRILSGISLMGGLAGMNAAIKGGKVLRLAKSIRNFDESKLIHYVEKIGKEKGLSDEAVAKIKKYLFGEEGEAKVATKEAGAVGAGEREDKDAVKGTQGEEKVGEGGKAENIDKKFVRGEDHHLRTDPKTGMRNKELLFLPEGIDYLRTKFGREVEITFTDVTGMGVGNDKLGRENVDYCFELMGEIIDELYGKDKLNRPIEVVRLGGDEIMFITKKGDSVQLDKFFSKYNEKKNDFIKKLGGDTYDIAKLETNVKSAMKLITKEDWWVQASSHGGEKEIREALIKGLTEKLKEHGITPNSEKERRIDDLLVILARARVEKKDPKNLAEPLGHYRAPSRMVDLGRTTDTVGLDNISDGIARADSDIGKIKGGKSPGSYNEGNIKETAEKYVQQGRDVERNIREIQELEKELGEIRKNIKEGRDKKLDVSKLEVREGNMVKQIRKKEATDPGTGALRLDKIEGLNLVDIFDIPKSSRNIEVTKIDIPYFGVFNNHYDYATADLMMKRIYEIIASNSDLKKGDMIIRDGGTFYVLKLSGEGGSVGDFKGIKGLLDKTLQEYVNHNDPKVKNAMANEAVVKSIVDRKTEKYGETVVSNTNSNSLDNVGGETVLSLIKGINFTF